MTADELRTATRHLRPAVLVGGGLGLALLAAYFVYDILMTPPRPDLPTADAAQVVAYVSSDRGLPTLPRIEGQRFFQEWRYVLTESPKKKEELTDCVAKLSDKARGAFSESMFKHFKRAFLDDAKRYAQTPAEQRYGFLKKKAAEYRSQATLLKDVAVGFKKQFSGRQDDLQKWIMEHTTAEERALGEPYLDAVKRVREQVKKEQRAAKPPPPQTPKP